jgi:hypothetical protein
MSGSPVARYGLAVVLIIGLVIGVAALYVYGPRSSGAPSTVSFTVLADEDGFNGSVQHGIPWPMITVHLGDYVTIKVINDGRVESHGFAVESYFPQGLVVGPGQNASFTFTANTVGNFTFYCNIFCTVHEYMLGTLVVRL